MFLGTAGDSFSVHNGKFFSTIDKENDGLDTYNCALFFHGGWWYDCCIFSGSNLNGVYGTSFLAQCISYYTLTDYYASLSYVEIKIREKRTAL